MPDAAALLAALRPLARRGLLLAYSGGVDSALLLAALARLRAEGPCSALAVTFTSPLHVPAEGREAAALAAQLGVPHRLLACDVLANEAVASNPPDRCYACKHALFSQLRALAEAEGLGVLLEGSHAGDAAAWRPGRRALAELGVRSPLAELGFTKAAIRALARAWGLPVVDKPSAPCLATRFPYGTRLTPGGLARVAAAEAALSRRCPHLAPLRVRDHFPLARIEVAPEAFAALLACREALVADLRALGYAFVTLDLAGFRSGSFDPPPAPPLS